MTRTARRVGIVLFQLGGPDTLEAIQPFLYNLFCDPDIIDFPFARIGRKPLAKLISTTRARKVQHHYSTIGGGSPIRPNTERQARALQRELRSRGVDAHCFVAMQFLLLTMVALPLKMALRLLWHIKYVWITPWFNI